MSHIRHIGPSYPVRPARPPGERESGQRPRKPPDPPPSRVPDEPPDEPGNDDNRPTIDEYI